MAKIENDQLILQIDHAEGTILTSIQKALILGIEKIGISETVDSEDHKDAVYWLSCLLRASLLDSSQTNVGLGKNPYNDPKKMLCKSEKLGRHSEGPGWVNATLSGYQNCFLPGLPKATNTLTNLSESSIGYYIDPHILIILEDTVQCTTIQDSEPLF